MTALLVILVILAGVGAAFIIAEEYIFQWLQIKIENSNLPEFLKVLASCPVCLSFWTTLILSLCFGFQWYSILLALTATLISKIIVHKYED